jgi:hypothetical protein
MKGIKVCVNWMMDNQYKKLQSKQSQYTIWFDGIRFRSKIENSEEVGIIRNFKTLGQYEWDELIDSKTE